ncbi:sensor domain-containing diguanylate cyclase [Deinococcus sp. Leaf326]|uniref:sensor domain-containing diguanylate cyclase n=1 Tax=Deinococcus sp. Leaf326 TaxID=1736338 RepID=UPI0009E81577|nr:sensor domain-containing diguanylate cyclase [Deinococcus sp. Leaf326]
MIRTPVPTNEAARLLDLAGYGILDTPAEANYDRIVRLAARLLGVSSAILNFVDEDRHWNKAAAGTARTELPRSDSPCAWVVSQDTPLVVPDLREDERFADLGLVRGGARMYAGTSLVTPRGHHVGTLCVFDTAPRCLGDDDLQVLQDLAALAVSELELRRHTEELGRQLGAQDLYSAGLQRELDNARTLEAVTALSNMSGTPQEITGHVAQLLGEAVGADWTALVTIQGECTYVRVVHSQSDFSPALNEILQQTDRQSSGVTATLLGAQQNVYVDHYAAHPAAVPDAAQLGLRAVAWVPLGLWEQEQDRAVLVVLRAGGEERRPWRASDRALLEAAGRSIRSAMQRHDALAAATRISRQDALTGIGNRRALEEALAAAPASDWTVTLMDLDGFKGLNDAAGHAEGDKALKVFAGALAAEFALDGRVYRLGGDEFVLLLPGLYPEDEVLERIDLAVLAVRQVAPTPLGVSTGTVTTQMGVLEELLEMADTRMYAAKRRRKDRMVEVGV